MNSSDHPASWYAANRWPDAIRAPATGTIETDICVVGGGFAGLHVARLLSLRGHAVTLLERRRIGWAASGRNGGFVGAGYAQRASAIIARVGEAHARDLHTLSREGVELVRKASFDEDPLLIMGTGKLSVYRTDQGLGFAPAVKAVAEKLGSSGEPWNVAQVREVARSTRYFQGIHDPVAFQVHPLNLALALARQIERAGGLIHENSAAIGLAADGAGWQVTTTDRGRIRARHVVLAGNADLGRVHQPAAHALLPVATYVAVTQKLGKDIADAVRWRGAISDTRRAGDYYRIVDDDRLLWGGRITTDTREPQALRAMMRADVQSVYPQLRMVEIAYAWPGLMGYAIHLMPHVARLRKGLWLSSAFGGHGVAQTAAAAIAIAGAITDDDDRLRLFAPWPVSWAGGFLGRVATQGAYWWMQARDWIDERKP